MQYDLFPEHDEARFLAKIDTAIERIRMAEAMSHRYMDSPLYIRISGGKDSSVIQQLAIDSGCDVRFTHSHTTVDTPTTVRFIRSEFERLRSLGYVATILYPEKSMWQLIEHYNGLPPNRKMRYCCSYFKERTVFTDSGRKAFIVTGVRWAESHRRKTRAEFEVIASDPKRSVKVLMEDNDLDRKLFEDCRLKGERVCNPIIDWSDDDVWEYIRRKDLPYNPLYDQGHKRVGCIGCPMVSPTERHKSFEQYPKYRKAYFDAIVRGMAKGRANGIQYTWDLDVGFGTTTNDPTIPATQLFNWWIMSDFIKTDE